MAFKGMFDGTVAIDQNREERAHQVAMQAQQIQAQAIAQRNQLNAQRSMENSRLNAAASANNADNAMKQKQLDASNDFADRSLAQKAGEFDTEMAFKQDTFDAGQELRDQQQQSAKLAFDAAQADFKEDQARRAALTSFRQSAFGAGMMSSMLNGVATPGTISGINKANNIADGEPGSIVAMGGAGDGGWYDVVALDAQGQKGKMRQTVSPMQMMALGSSIFDKDTMRDWAASYRQRDQGNTQMNIALDRIESQQAIADAKLAARGGGSGSSGGGSGGSGTAGAGALGSGGNILHSDYVKTLDILTASEANLALDKSLASDPNMQAELVKIRKLKNQLYDRMTESTGDPMVSVTAPDGTTSMVPRSRAQSALSADSPAAGAAAAPSTPAATQGAPSAGGETMAAAAWRVKQEALTKPKGEQKAYYQDEMKKFLWGSIANGGTGPKGGVLTDDGTVIGGTDETPVGPRVEKAEKAAPTKTIETAGASAAMPAAEKARRWENAKKGKATPKKRAPDDVVDPEDMPGGRSESFLPPVRKSGETLKAFEKRSRESGWSVLNLIANAPVLSDAAKAVEALVEKGAALAGDVRRPHETLGEWQVRIRKQHGDKTPVSHIRGGPGLSFE